jgi:hypothetical protein
MPKTFNNTISFNDGAGNIIENGVIQTNQITTNGNVNLTGAIINGSNTIAFNESYKFTDIYENCHMYKTFFLDYGGTTYNVGEQPQQHLRVVLYFQQLV